MDGPTGESRRSKRRKVDGPKSESLDRPLSPRLIYFILGVYIGLKLLFSGLIMKKNSMQNLNFDKEMFMLDYVTILILLVLVTSSDKS